MTSIDTAANGAQSNGIGVLDRERIVAKPGFNRWMVPPAALAIHLCIGMAYGFSVFWLPLSKALGGAKPISCGYDTSWFGFFSLPDALFTTRCDWLVSQLGWMYTLFFVFLGSSAALWGGWLERVGPRRAGVYAAFLWCGGLVISALGVYLHQLWIMWLGSGVLGGIGLGLGYISPVSTLVKWFPDRRGMATGMAIMGFGGGALIGSPLANYLMNTFKTDTSPGVWQTFLILAAGYFVYMIAGAFGYRVPPANWRPEGWTPPTATNAMITRGHVHLRDAHKTPQFWLIWGVLCLNVSAGIGVIGVASPMLQEIFGGKLIGMPSLRYADLNAAQIGTLAGLGAAFASLLSLFNIGGRFFWASLSDKIGRKTTYFIFFVLGFVLYATAPWSAHAGFTALFIAAFCIILTMYGGGFATVPAYLADIFGTQFVGAIHGRLLTAWSAAGVIGPFMVFYLRDNRIAGGVPRDQVYDLAMIILAALLVGGFICNFFVRPLAPRWFMKDEEVAALQAKPGDAVGANGGSYGIGKGGLDTKAALAWAAVLIPIAWAVYFTLTKAAQLF